MESVAQPWYRELHWQICIAMALGIFAGWAGGQPFAARAIIARSEGELGVA